MREELIQAFVQIGKLFNALAEEKEWSGYETGLTAEEYQKWEYTIQRQMVFNGWFTKDNVLQSLTAWAKLLKEDTLKSWMEEYTFQEKPKSVAIIMAGNIPLVGFHDFLSVLLSGHRAICKMSTDDCTLLPLVVDALVNLNPEIKDRIVLTQGRLPAFDAVIATGSNNSMQHFEQYFSQYPHIFRRNRTSVALVSGSETKEDFEALGEDIFTYYGLGCRNVTHLLLPRNFELPRFFEGIFKFSDVIYHKKYGNNYDYNKAVYLMNKMPLLDNNFVLLRETEDLFSPIGMIHYHFYDSQEDVKTYLKRHEADIQAIVGQGNIPFGEAQKPALNEYADKVNTMEWLAKL